jgi:hypothetical protein
MKQISCHINEDQYKKWRKKIANPELKDYAVNKVLVLGFINGEPLTLTNLKIKILSVFKQSLKEAYEILDQAP